MREITRAKANQLVANGFLQINSEERIDDKSVKADVTVFKMWQKTASIIEADCYRTTIIIKGAKN